MQAFSEQRKPTIIRGGQRKTLTKKKPLQEPVQQEYSGCRRFLKKISVWWKIK